MFKHLQRSNGAQARQITLYTLSITGIDEQKVFMSVSNVTHFMDDFNVIFLITITVRIGVVSYSLQTHQGVNCYIRL